MKKKIFWVVGILVLLGAVGMGIWKFRNGKGSRLSVKRGSIVEAIYGLGTVVSNRDFNMKVGVTSQIREIYVKEGQTVKAGANLLRLEDNGIQKAPFSGTVTSIPFKQGETVFPQAAILTLVDMGDRYIRVSLEQQGAIRVRPGQKAYLTFENMRGQKFDGSVESVFPRADQFVANITVHNLPNEILPGMTADVAIQVGQKPDALLIPVAALSGGRVIVFREGRSTKIEVKVGIVDGEWAEVLDGDLRQDDEVVVRRD